jgi:uncharacterized protein YukE
MLDIRTNVILGVFVAAVSAGAGWTANGWRLDARLDRMKAEYEAAATAASESALARYRSLEQQKQEALDAAATRLQQNAAAARAARTDAERLRKQIATAERVSSATIRSLRDYTTSLAAVFAECIGELEVVAGKADGHALDTEKLHRAWPQ